MEPLLGTVIDFREPLLDIDRHHSVYCLTVRPVFSSTRQTNPPHTVVQCNPKVANERDEQQTQARTTSL